MKTKILFLIAAAALSVMSVNAEYSVKIPLELPGGGHLPKGAILLVNKNTPPITLEPETSKRQSIFESIFVGGVNGNKYTSGNASAYYSTNGTILLEKQLITGKSYFIDGGGPAECIYTAIRICVANTNCTINDSKLSGTKTLLIYSKSTSSGWACRIQKPDGSMTLKIYENQK